MFGIVKPQMRAISFQGKKRRCSTRTPLSTLPIRTVFLLYDQTANILWVSLRAVLLKRRASLGRGQVDGLIVVYESIF